MSTTMVIDCDDLRKRLYRTPDGMRAAQTWMRVNGIDPNVVPLHSQLLIEDSAFGPVIRYTAFRRNEAGRFYVDPDGEGEAACEDRTALLHLPPPADWLTTDRGGEQ
ncbi:hypothetical protein [Streptomyces sp. NPDC055058]